MCNDAMFKAVFRSIEARKIVVSILSKLTGIEEERLSKADFQGGELVKRKITEKKKESDIIVKVTDREKIIVEINGSGTNREIFKKNSEYAFSIIVETTTSSSKYANIILINIDNFNRYKSKRPILTYKLRDNVR